MRFDHNNTYPRRPSLSTIDSQETRVSYRENDEAPLRKDNMASSVAFDHEPKRHNTFTNVDIGSNYTVPPATSTALSPTNDVPQRPQYLARVPSVQTRYMEMLLHLDKIPRLHNILASAFTWILLAGFLVVPGTYTKIKTSQTFQNADSSSDSGVAHDIVHSIANIGLLWVSGFLALVGTVGCFYLWFRWRQNYVWLINRIFLPATLNSVAGLLTTIVNVYTAQKGVWSITAKITVIVSGSCVGVAGCLFFLYNFWVLQRVREKHEQSMNPEEIANQERDKKRESILEKVKRKAHEPAIQPDCVNSFQAFRVAISAPAEGTMPVQCFKLSSRSLLCNPRILQRYPFPITADRTNTLSFLSLSFMPNITSQRTGLVARRQRRRTRQRQKRLSVSFPHRQQNHRRSIPKRQVREQSADVDDCFEDCQELGYHLDPDIHVGSLAAQGNPFSILDPDYSSDSTPDPIPPPYQDHTIRPPNPFLAELEWDVAKKSYLKLEDIEGPTFPEAEEKEDRLPRVSKFWWRSPGQVDDLEANRSSVSKTTPPTARATIPPSVQTSSIPTTPPSGANIKLPGAFPQDTAPTPTSRTSKKRKLSDAPPPAFLTGYRIPSPLLYHKPSRDALPNIDDEENTCICLGPSFEHARNEHQNIFDPGSNGSSCSEPSADLESEATQPLLQNQYRFVAAALPNMGKATPYSLVEQAVLCSDPKFYTNTRPYLSPRKSPINSKTATGSSTPSTGRSVSPLAEAKNLTSHIYAAEDLRSIDTPLPANDISEQSSTLQQPRPVFRRHDLIFPQLPASTVYRDRSLGRYFGRPINFWSRTQDGNERRKFDTVAINTSTVDYPQDRRSKFQELWDAYEKAVLGLKSRDSTSSKPVVSDPFCSRPDRNTLPIVGVPGPQKGSALFPAPVNPIRPTPIDLKLSKEIDIPARSLSPRTALVPARLYEKQYLGLTKCWSSDIWNLKQRPLPTLNAVVEQIKETQSHGQIQQAVDWLAEDLDLDKMFHDEQEDDRAYLPWLQAGWDGHLFYPETTASEVSLPLSSPFEDVELGDEGQLTDCDSWGGTQVNEEVEDGVWWDWDDDASAWSDPSEDEFFDFDL